MLLKEFVIETDLKTFYEIFWSDPSWYANFLENQLQDLNVEVCSWETSNTGNESIVKRVRKVKSFHPSKVSFPGLPSHAEVCIDLNIVIYCYFYDIIFNM
jgi:hypothetical protein